MKERAPAEIDRLWSPPGLSISIVRHGRYSVRARVYANQPFRATGGTSGVFSPTIRRRAPAPSSNRSLPSHAAAERRST